MSETHRAERLHRSIMIGATGRNAGKTEFACSVISALARQTRVHAVKVTTIYDTGGSGKVTSCARGGDGCGVCSAMDCDLILTEESIADDRALLNGKDTVKMLGAGAAKVWWLRVREPALPLVHAALARLVPPDGVIVIESNAARRFVEPDLFFIVAGPGSPVGNRRIKDSARLVLHHADEIVTNSGTGFSLDPESVTLEGGRFLFPRRATAILLAGGMSLRMGTDKRFLRLHGIPMVELAHRALVGTFSEIIVSSGDDTVVLPGVRQVRDELPNAGPLGGIVSALAQSAHDLAFVAACDIPDLPLDFVNLMLRLARDHEVVVPCYEDGRFEPLFAVYTRAVLPHLRGLLASGERRIRMLYGRVDTCYVPVPSSVDLRNLNTRAEVQNYVSRHDPRYARF